MPPVVFVAIKISKHESKQSKHQGDRDVTRDISRPGQQPKQIIKPDKKEHTE